MGLFQCVHRIPLLIFLVLSVDKMQLGELTLTLAFREGIELNDLFNETLDHRPAISCM